LRQFAAYLRNIAVRHLKLRREPKINRAVCVRYLSRHEDKDLSAHDWIALDDTLASTVIGRWIHEHLRAAKVTCRVDALPALCDAALAGLGLALLPYYLGDPASGLRRFTPKTPAEPRSALWLLTHEDLRRTARIRATLDFLAKALASERALLEGNQPTPRRALGNRVQRNQPSGVGIRQNRE